MNITKRVIKWNSARYEQEHDNQLTEELLRSEVEEFVLASYTGPQGDLIDQIDALCDIVYVALGAMWKLGLSAEQIDKCLSAVCDANDTKVAIKTEAHLKANKVKGPDFIPPEVAIERVLNDG